MGLSFYKGKKIFVTGHTGFKGSWLCRILLNAGADVYGFSLSPNTEPALFDLLKIEKEIHHTVGDIRDYEALLSAFKRAAPDFAIHLAAQPLVLESYKNPAYTYETNVMGTVHILECIRNTDTVKSFLNVTTDKVYENKEWIFGYRENDRLNGFDPYSNSKSCSELVTESYQHSFFKDKGAAISTARAGNVIGGGDFAENRIIPDCVRAALRGETITIRNPNAVRPYQHVLEPLFAYLLILQKQAENVNLAGSYNIGPDEKDCLTTKALAEIFIREWGGNLGYQLIGTTNETSCEAPNEMHESGMLRLDCAKLKTIFKWRPRYDIYEAVRKTVSWTKAYQNGENLLAVMDKQIAGYGEK